MKKIIYVLYIVVLLILTLLIAIYPDRYMQACFSGIKLWAFIVLPSLLPYFFLTTLLTNTGSILTLSKHATKLTRFLYNCSGISAYVQTMSFLSGYPVGAKIIDDLYKNSVISSDEATRMSTFCSTSGPLFIVGSVGMALFNSKLIGLTLLISHYFSSILCGVCFRFYGKQSKVFSAPLTNNSTSTLYDCIYQSIISVLIVGGFVAIFYTLSQILHDFKILFLLEKPLSLLLGKNYSEAFSQGLVECTMGCKLLSQFPSRKAYALACSLISFGGISIIFQSVVFLKKAKVKIAIFICSKFLQMLFSFILFYLFSVLLKI